MYNWHDRVTVSGGPATLYNIWHDSHKTDKELRKMSKAQLQAEIQRMREQLDTKRRDWGNMRTANEALRKRAEEAEHKLRLIAMVSAGPSGKSVGTLD